MKGDRRESSRLKSEAIKRGHGPKVSNMVRNGGNADRMGGLGFFEDAEAL